MPSENPLKVTSGETFVSQLEKRNPIKSTVATQVQTQTGGTNQKEELPVRNRPQEKNQAAEKNFLDADKDGECDNLGEGKTPEPKLDGTGSNSRGTKNFVDADKDGECDNLGEGKTPEPKLDGTGSNGKGSKNFMDADKDGECDNLGEGKTPEPKLDGTGSNEKSQQGKGSKGFGKDK